MELHITDLSKTYPNGVRALDNCTLHLRKGMFGLLGPNGAGKSSLMRTIATLQQPSAGSIHFNEIDVLQQPMELRKTLGYLPQSFGVYPRVSAERLLDYLAQLKGLVDKKSRQRMIDYCLELTNLTHVSKQHVSGYSGGMKQRFGIAQLLLNNPQLIIVDEPTAGLDPAERQRFLNILREVGTEHIVIFSTHIVEDVKDLCTDLAVLNKGRVLLHATPDAAMQSLHGKVWTTTVSADRVPEYQAQYQVLSASFNRHNTKRVRVLADQIPAPEFEPTEPHLEDVYFAALASA